MAYILIKKNRWETKSLNYFYPKTFSTKATLHDKTKEQEAREEYEIFVNTKVACGAMISKLNPWLSYSPDGVIMKDVDINFFN